jgi:hydroxyacylglutathione hydrolase
MVIKTIAVGMFAANCYFIMDEDTKETAVIDPGGDSEDLIEILDKMGALVKFILLTHGHADHTGAITEISSKYNVPIYINEKDQELMFNNAYMFGSIKGDNTLIKNICDDDKLCIGSTEISTVETPGHTPGGVCFIVEDNIFTGDTLFYGSVGRTDLPGGSYNTLISSIKTKLLVMPDNYTVLPGHGPKSTIKIEKGSNPFL